jgi:hypothetical protein
MNEVISENLERRFQAILESKENTSDFLSFVSDYIEYVCTNQIICNTIRSLIKKGYLTKKPLYTLIYHYQLTSTHLNEFNENNLPLAPLFMNKEIEEKYNLIADFYKLIKETHEEDELLRKKGISPLDSVKNDPDFYTEYKHEEFTHLRKLHNYLMDSLTKNEILPMPQYNEKEGILSLCGENITITTGKATNAHKLLSILQKNWYRELDTEDIRQEWNEPEERLEAYKSMVYNTNTIIAKQSKIPDFLEYRNYKIRVNPDYLP